VLTKSAESGKDILMTTVNWGEVFYILLREHGQQEAEKIQRVIETFPIEFVSVDLALAKQAAIYKAEKGLPYADCFSAALTKLRKGELITRDREFKILEDEIGILWLN
jgi:predicted nucleic acid-binding protein